MRWERKAIHWNWRIVASRECTRELRGFSEFMNDSTRIFFIDDITILSFFSIISWVNSYRIYNSITSRHNIDTLENDECKHIVSFSRSRVQLIVFDIGTVVDGLVGVVDDDLCFDSINCLRCFKISTWLAIGNEHSEFNNWSGVSFSIDRTDLMLVLVLVLVEEMIRLVGVLGIGEGREFLIRCGFFTGVEVENNTRFEVPAIGLEGAIVREITIQ